MRRRVLKKKNMADGQTKLQCVASSSEEDMYSSCFSTTKYTCLKCKIPICNNCSVFEKDEDSSGWAPLKSVGSLRALCTGVCKRRTEDCITLITAFLFFFLLSLPVFFAENKLLLIFISFSASTMFSRYVSPLAKIGNFPK